jgi:hypothetical protein
MSHTVLSIDDSDDTGRQMVDELLAAGASGFLGKPFAIGDLLALIGRYLDQVHRLRLAILGSV